MRQNANNTFSGGLNLDLHPIVTPNTVLTDNLNGTFITYNGNEFCLQNDRGNRSVESLTSGYVPIGIKEHNGILYIVSVNNNMTEIGTYPAPHYPNEWSSNLYDEEWEDSFKDENGLYHYDALHVIGNHEPFSGIDLGYTTETPITVDIQDSYDGSVNIILISDNKQPRIINSGFSVLPNNNYKFINRNQDVFTNIYKNDTVSLDTELIRTSSILTNIALGDPPVQPGGQLKGGNYTFYLKFGDADFNQTDVVAESGIVSIFNGTDSVPSTISGTLADERTDKMVQLKIIGLNKIYSKLYIYFSREYSDTQGYRMTECGMLKEPIDIEPDIVDGEEQDFQSIWITGFEQQAAVNIEELNVDYHTIDWARAETQHSNMLFLGNIGQEETFKLYKKLDDFTKDVSVTLSQTTLSNNSGDDFSHKNYYSVKNIYNSLGYWPEEWYRFAIVYILEDGSTTPAFNMRGGVFSNLTTHNNNNDKGVFQTPKVDVLQTESPISFNFLLPNLSELGEYKNKIKGWFVVRQKRIPTTICQGLSIGTDKRSYLPTVWNKENGTNKWYIESFLSLDRSKTTGEKWTRTGWNAIVRQVEGQPHILRPFLQIFSSDGIKTSSIDINARNANYLVYNVYIAGRYVENNEDDFANGIVTKLQQYGYNSTNDICIYQKNILSAWDGKPGEFVTFAIYKGTIYGIKNGDVYTPTEKILYYVATVAPIQGTTINGEEGSFYYSQEQLFPTGSIDAEHDKMDYRFIIEDDTDVNLNALLSLDPCLNPNVGSMFDGSLFDIVQDYSMTTNVHDLVFDYNIESPPPVQEPYTMNSIKTVLVNEYTKSKVIDESSIFSNVAGSGGSTGDFAYTQKVFGVKTDNSGGEGRIYKYDDRVTPNYGTTDYYGFNSTHNLNLVRGVFTPYLGIDNSFTPQSLGLYSIKHKNIGENALGIRENDNSEYYCVSDRIYINSNDLNNSINVYRGDCYICKVGIRILRNFIDSTAPVTSTIVDPLGWERWVRQRSLYGGDSTDLENGGKDVDSYASVVDYSEVNLSDLNAVDLGYWVTFPCLSSYNLGLRSLDTFHVDEMSIMGSPRSFYPLSGASAMNKVGDSYLLNDGLSATVGRKRYNLMPDVPYSKSEFSNRIMFSNVNITDAFTNGYRTFQGLSYKDYDKQYGAITKLISLGQNIFIVMEHGLGLVPVNPKALLQTTTGEAIHIYGYGVLPDEMTIISQDYGSKYEHSVLRTPIGIYGIDVDARKIWRFSDKQGFETISDMKVETYLKDFLANQPEDINMSIQDIRTHYNAKKGDIMFTWYANDKIYSICYNERQNIWVTRYDWCPIVSENVNDEFYSLNQDQHNLEDSTYYIWDHAYNVAYNNGDSVSTWYNDTKNFEFEFIVSNPIGVNKIFNNLQIISNNVAPQKLIISIIGDDYEFKREIVNYAESRGIRLEVQDSDPSKVMTTADIHNDLNSSPDIDISYKWDWRLHQNAIVKMQDLKDIYKWGRRLGNMQYKEGSWFIQIEPLVKSISETDVRAMAKEIRIRDKWAKIRIRYSGENLAIITAIRTLINV